MRGGLFGKVFLYVLFAASLLVSGCERMRERLDGETDSNGTSPASVEAPQSVHLAFGNPSGANQGEENNYLIVGEGSVISYNSGRGTVNWVSWRTTRADLGDSRPRPDFRLDPRLPERFKRVGYYDYSGSGYDRGHMVPSADRFANARLNEETFMMTNIVPQTPELNQYPWQKLEAYARSQAWKGFDVYQIAGAYGERGVLKGKVVVPTNCWKIVAIVRPGRGIDGRTRIIAVDMPNADWIENEPWEKFKTTMRAIEEKTGYDFFAELSRQMQDEMETKVEMSNKKSQYHLR